MSDWFPLHESNSVFHENFQLFPYRGFQSPLITSFKHTLFGRWVVFCLQEILSLGGACRWRALVNGEDEVDSAQLLASPRWDAARVKCRALQPPVPRPCFSPSSRTAASPLLECWWEYPLRCGIKRTFPWLSVAWAPPSRAHSALVSCLPGCFSVFTGSVGLGPSLSLSLLQGSDPSPTRGLKCAHLHEQIFRAQMKKGWNGAGIW